MLENFVNFDIVTGLAAPVDSVSILGNRNVKPEEITSYELGYQTLLWDSTPLFNRLDARIDLFYNRLDRVSTGLTPVSAGQLMVLTGGGGSIYGGEIGFEASFSDWLKGFINYSYQERKLDRDLLGKNCLLPTFPFVGFSCEHAFCSGSGPCGRGQESRAGAL